MDDITKKNVIKQEFGKLNVNPTQKLTREEMYHYLAILNVQSPQSRGKRSSTRTSATSC